MGDPYTTEALLDLLTVDPAELASIAREYGVSFEQLGHVLVAALNAK